jgi:hypothetical protein
LREGQRTNRRGERLITSRTTAIESNGPLHHSPYHLTEPDPPIAFKSHELKLAHCDEICRPIRATTGRLSLSTTARARTDLNVSGVSCIANISRFGQRVPSYDSHNR